MHSQWIKAVESPCGHKFLGCLCSSDLTLTDWVGDEIFAVDTNKDISEAENMNCLNKQVI